MRQLQRDKTSMHLQFRQSAVPAVSCVGHISRRSAAPPSTVGAAIQHACLMPRSNSQPEVLWQPFSHLPVSLPQHRGHSVLVHAISRDAAAEAMMMPPRWQGPKVDWSRYHLQVLFVDHSDQLRAKLAAAFFEQVAEWNGYSRCLLPSTAGVQVVSTRKTWDWSLQAGLMARAHMLGLPPKVFARSPEAFENRDLDVFDVVVAVDAATRDEMLSRVDRQYLPYYEEKVRVLSEYGQQQPLSDSEVFTMGGLALMPRGMSLQLQQDLQGLRQVLDLPRPSMTDASEQAAACWDTCIRSAMLGAAGLVRYLIDSYPDDLPEYDPL